MARDYEEEIHYDSSGSIDIDYYVTEARRLRNEAIAEVFSSMVQRVKRHFGKETAIPMNLVFHK